MIKNIVSVVVISLLVVKVIYAAQPYDVKGVTLGENLRVVLKKFEITEKNYQIVADLNTVGSSVLMKKGTPDKDGGGESYEIQGGRATLQVDTIKYNRKFAKRRIESDAILSQLVEKYGKYKKMDASRSGKKVKACWGNCRIKNMIFMLPHMASFGGTYLGASISYYGNDTYLEIEAFDHDLRKTNKKMIIKARKEAKEAARPKATSDVDLGL